MNIVLSTDDKYVMPTGILMRSLCHNNSCHIDFFVLVGDDFNVKGKALLENNLMGFDASIVFLAIPKQLETLLPMDKPGQPKYITIATYYRLFLQDILPESIDKALYLDGDIICRSSLLPLWDTDIEGKPIAAVFEIENNDQRYQRLGYEEKYGYFNAGVMLINMKYWREHQIQNVFIDFLKNNSEKIRYHDQDVLNSVFHQDKVVLDVKYNVLNSYFVKGDIQYLYSEEQIKQARRNPVLIHYSSHLKPWFKGCSHPYAGEFLKYKKDSIWRKEELRTFPATTIRGRMSNFFIWLGVRKYNGNYICKNDCHDDKKTSA